MTQLSKDQAVKMAESGAWKDWTDEQIVRFQLFQDRLCMDFSRYHEAITKVLGRPVYTHEFAFRHELIKEYLEVKDAPTFEEIISLIPEEKRMLFI